MHGESYHIYTTQQHNCKHLSKKYIYIYIIVSSYQHTKFKPDTYTFDCVIFYKSQTPVVPT